MATAWNLPELAELYQDFVRETEAAALFTGAHVDTSR